MLKHKLRQNSLLYQMRRDLRHRLELMGIIPNPHIPDPLLPDDTFLVSYPKSGNTWLRFLLACLQYPEADINFHTISAYVPAGADSANSAWQEGVHCKRPRFIKEHARFQPAFPRVIYLVRDGRAAYISYYKFLFDRLPPGTTLAQFIAKKDLKFGDWSQHVNSWCKADLPSERFLLIKYEDMLHNPMSVLQHIANFTGQIWTQPAIRQAIERSSFKQMRQIEKETGFPEQNVFSGQFIRRGKADGWQKKFTPVETAVFKQYHNHTLLRLGYEQNADWSYD